MTDIQTAIYDITQLELKAQQEIAALRNDISLSQRDVAQKNAVASDYLTQIADKIKESKQRARSALPIDEDVINKLKLHKDQVKSLKDALRAANIMAMQNNDRQEVRNREKLLGGEGLRNRGDSKKNGSKEEALRHSEKVTDVLRKVREMMVAEVNHGAEINEELHGQGKALEGVIEDHERITDGIGTGRGLLSRLRQREFTDKLLVTLSFLFFLGVCLYIIKERIRFMPFGLFRSIL